MGEMIRRGRWRAMENKQGDGERGGERKRVIQGWRDKEVIVVVLAPVEESHFDVETA